MLARDKHSSLLRKSVHYALKSFITLAPVNNLGIWLRIQPSFSHFIVVDKLKKSNRTFFKQESEKNTLKTGGLSQSGTCFIKLLTAVIYGFR
jgi:hypothetical protein